MDEDKPPVSASSAHHTFILRCWVGEDQQVRCRLIEVTTGRSQLLGDLAGLVPLLQQRMFESSTPTEAQP